MATNKTKINPQERQKKVSDLLKDFYKLDGENVSPKEVEKQIEQEPTETIYELTQKALDMANAVMATKGVKNMMSNPVMSSTKKSQPDTKQIQQTNIRNTQIRPESAANKVTNNKDPDRTTVSPNQVRPWRLKDTVADILAKMYNFMLKKYISDDKEFIKDKKYRKSLVRLKEKHTDELISLFGGKYRKGQAKDKDKIKETTDQVKPIVQKAIEAHKAQA